MSDQHFDQADAIEDVAETNERDTDNRAGDWFAVSRKMITHPIVGADVKGPAPADPERKAWTPYEAWGFLLGKAAYRRCAVRSAKGTDYLLDAGQLIAGRSYLARRFNWSEKAVRLFVARLVNDGMLAVSKGPAQAKKGATCKGHVPNVLTLCNYQRYQTAPQEKGHVKGQVPPKIGATNRNNNNNSSLTLRDGSSGFDDRKREQRQRIAEPADDASQLPQWQNREALERLDRSPAGPVSRFVRNEVDRHGWSRAVFGPAPGDGEDNPLFEFLDPADLARWGGRPATDDYLPSNVVPLRRPAAAHMGGLSL